MPVNEDNVRNTAEVGHDDWTQQTTKLGESLKTKLQNIQNTPMNTQELNNAVEDCLKIANNLIQMGKDPSYPFPTL